ncbi:recA-like DNA recombinase [Stenotrophomonas phage Mendera]|uniref:RecA-like DNA recombinase n=1 Tax=Stenotrophomonas phage Mendera TaxID=2650877 RepID=A0A5P8PIR4_9CAUD|nr:DNA repair protein [Stenotrophomonas phage Mendera]QFR56583.1 recA-like DNA recombinase [Stenotrophomonas phage Mendera]
MANQSLAERILKNSVIKEAAVLDKSQFFKKKDLVRTMIPLLNLAQSGELDGGFGSGLTVWAGPSKHFKTSLLLASLKAYLDKFQDAIAIFYDSEFGTPQSYFTSFGIPLDRVIHIPITNIEMLKFDMMQQLEGLQKGDKVFIAVDSVGNLASKKEVEDAINEKSVADMTRAKALKSLFRIVTPYFTLKDIPCHVVNHTYKTQEMYSKDVVSGGTGIYYSADNIFIIGRQQDKKDDELLGYRFILRAEKSRYVREGSKFPLTVSFDKGISKWSGLLDLALETGHVVKPSNGWYSHAGDDKKLRLNQTETSDFWLPILTGTDFAEKLKEKFQLSLSQMIEAGDIDYATGEVLKREEDEEDDAD